MAGSTLDLSTLPPIFVSTTHLELEAIHKLEDQLMQCNAVLTYDIKEARLVLSKTARKRRAQFDLQSQGVWTEELSDRKGESVDDLHTAKRRKTEGSKARNGSVHDPVSLEDADTESEHEEGGSRDTKLFSGGPVKSAFESDLDRDIVRVLSVDWLEESIRLGNAAEYAKFCTFAGRIVEQPTEPLTPVINDKNARSSQATGQSIIDRAKADTSMPPRPQSHASPGRRHVGAHGAATNTHSYARGTSPSKHARLLQTTTSEFDAGQSSELPDMPDWVKQGIKYACQRISLAENENNDFISLLKEIKLARLLTNDEIGVRAYSTCIAAIAAYPCKISSPREMLALPGCDVKLANLFVEYANTGKLQAAEDARDDEELKVLRLFYEIWGVGATTAREFFYDRGWRDLDDIVEFGWSVLSRVQQIGVKFYDEFLTPIPRTEVEQIAAIIHRHAVKVRDEGIQSLLVGGYRRGKAECGDVDIIVSHPDETKTLNIINDIVASLETEELITHTLLLSLTTSHREQQTLPFKGNNSGGHGFDSLDKALVVWQDPHWPTRAAELAKNPKAKNPNIHRRVDIIIAPWRTVGCAVAGWTSGTTFQRDLRRYVKYVKGWKFDSSGVRDRTTGQVVDLEQFDGPDGVSGRAQTMVQAEKRVFAGLGLEWREPWQRCTG